MRSLDDVIKNKVNGLYYGNRVLLPFKAEILKAIIEKNIITDFSATHKGAHCTIAGNYTEIYFLDYVDLSDEISKYETIKLVLVEEGKDIFDINNHKKLLLHLKENHQLLIQEATEEILFIE